MNRFLMQKYIKYFNFSIEKVNTLSYVRARMGITKKWGISATGFGQHKSWFDIQHLLFDGLNLIFFLKLQKRCCSDYVRASFGVFENSLLNSVL